MPECGCIILARPTKKMGLYRQMIGRVLRPAEDKTDAVVLDHSGAVYRHGFVEDHVEWLLEPDKRSASAAHTKRLAASPCSRLLECTQCGAVRVGGEPCFHCGFLPQRLPRAVEIDDGELGLVDQPSSSRQGQRYTTQPSAPAGMPCSCTSRWSAVTNRAGRRTSTRRNSALGRRGARRRGQFHPSRKCVAGCARASSLTQNGEGQHEVAEEVSL